MPYTGGPMTEAMYYVLLALLNPSHGYRLMQDIEAVSQSRVTMGPGTLYGVLNRMLADGLILLDTEEGRRKVYRITPSGREALQAEHTRLLAMVRDFEDMNNAEEGGARND